MTERIIIRVHSHALWTEFFLTEEL